MYWHCYCKKDRGRVKKITNKPGNKKNQPNYNHRPEIQKAAKLEPNSPHKK
jgi:hypothetical protein